MGKLFRILWNSFLMALQELKVNKLRTFLSLFGVTIGIFCIIGVLALVDSLQHKVESDMNQLGSNMVQVGKWEFLNTNDYPWWKFINRPEVKYSEYLFLKQNTTDADAMYYLNNTNALLQYKDNTYNANVYGTSDEFSRIQTIDIDAGRYITENEFNRGMAVCVIGNEVATQLFKDPFLAVGQQISVKGNKVTVIGVVKKQGQMINIFQFDQSIIEPYHYFASIYNAEKLSPQIFVQSKPGISNKAMINELRGLMRQVRRLSPKQDDNFALNDINLFRDQIDSLFSVLNTSGWAIAGLSLLVGGFGIANIMFVTVRERRSQIGLKKALGAKNKTILTEFLIESAFLCVIGGLIGLILVWLLTLILSNFIPFPIFIAGRIIVLAFSICLFLGVLSGIIPASVAAKLNPVVAIRSN
ncbi:MAG TPA: ABC transporter permease [Arachidicoccus soli]|nr:ABC transporter permease [Arachidicoccus soli]HEU0226605.1 ABC transporter permease [Arachidicoccus soli]